MTIEVNFDGIVGPSHHYGGLGVGNVASLANESNPSHPRAGALQGLEKMRRVAAIGSPQFFLPPCRRPNLLWLRQLGFRGTDCEVLKTVSLTDARLLSAAWSSAFMWTANAATISPSADSGDRRLHLSVANLTSNLHRRQESVERFEQLRHVFADVPNAVVHPGLPSSYALRDEGAANHLRLSDDGNGGGQGLHVFVDGDAVKSGFPGRQSRRCSKAIARRHVLKSEQVFLLHQHPDAVEAGVFHNDVIATSHHHLMIHHEKAFWDGGKTLVKLDQAFLRNFGRKLLRIVVTENELSLNDAVTSYLFNSQIVTNSSGTFTIICPENCRHNSSANALVQRWIADDQNPIAEVIFLSLDQSMANGGGPACLRLRVQLTQPQLAAIPRQYHINDSRVDELSRWIEHWYPETLSISDLSNIDFAEHCWAALDDLETRNTSAPKTL